MSVLMFSMADNRCGFDVETANGVSDCATF